MPGSVGIRGRQSKRHYFCPSSLDGRRGGRGSQSRHQSRAAAQGSQRSQMRGSGQASGPADDGNMSVAVLVALRNGDGKARGRGGRQQTQAARAVFSDAARHADVADMEPSCPAAGAGERRARFGSGKGRCGMGLYGKGAGLAVCPVETRRNVQSEDEAAVMQEIQGRDKIA